MKLTHRHLDFKVVPKIILGQDRNPTDLCEKQQDLIHQNDRRLLPLFLKNIILVN